MSAFSTGKFRRFNNRCRRRLRKFLVMPIIINEIEISVEVAPNNNGGQATGTPVNAVSKEEIIRECVEKVMELLNQKTER